MNMAEKTYKQFLESKKIGFGANGFTVKKETLNPYAFEWQKDIIKWALKKGRCEMWMECGLGKTLMSLDWAKNVCEHENTNVIIFAPLAVAQQTQREGMKFGIPVNIIENQTDIKHGINVTNYEKLHKFEYSSFGGVVLDESSCLKALAGKTRNMLTDIFRNTPYKLGCSATPAPNDYMEIGCHTEFLGIMSYTEMLSTFFVHDSGDTSQWRLKGHAASKFWEWIASWAVVMQKPSDLGYSDDDFILPMLEMNEHVVHSENFEVKDGQYTFIAVEAQTLNERRIARRNSIKERMAKTAEIAQLSDDPILIWCDLNVEHDMLEKMIGNKAFSIRGSTTDENKIDYERRWREGERPVLITKPQCCGWGMNWQHCHRMIFVGLSDSFEYVYQAIRRCWRFGQTKPVEVHIVTADSEGPVRANIQRKQDDFQRMTGEMIKHTQKILSETIHETTRISEEYEATKSMTIPNWLRSA
jgi:superfamily II DNA or RNA helicase